jgi:hypothetical protein
MTKKHMKWFRRESSVTIDLAETTPGQLRGIGKHQAMRERKDCFMHRQKAFERIGKKLVMGFFLACFPLILSCSSSSSPNDVLGVAMQHLFEWINAFAMPLYLLPIRLAIMFGLITLCSALTFLQLGSRLPHWQVGLAILVGLVGASLPIQFSVTNSFWLKGWVFLLSFILTFVFPFTFPFFLTDKAGLQKWTFRGCLIFVALTFIFTFFRL